MLHTSKYEECLFDYHNLMRCILKRRRRRSSKNSRKCMYMTRRKREHKNRSYAFLCFMLFLLFILLRRKPNLRIIRTSMAIEQYLTSKRIESKTREQTVIHCDRNNVDDVIDVTISFAGLISFVNFCCQWHWYSHTHTERPCDNPNLRCLGI